MFDKNGNAMSLYTFFRLINRLKKRCLTLLLPDFKEAVRLQNLNVTILKCDGFALSSNSSLSKKLDLAGPVKSLKLRQEPLN